MKYKENFISLIFKFIKYHRNETIDRSIWIDWLTKIKILRFSFLYWNPWQINLPSMRRDRRREWFRYKYPQITRKYLPYRIFGWIFAQGWLSVGGKARWKRRKVSKGLDCSDIFRFLARKHHSLLILLLLCFRVTAHKTYILENVESY